VILLAGLAWSAKRLAGLGPPTDPGLPVTGRVCLVPSLGGDAGDIEDDDLAPGQSARSRRISTISPKIVPVLMIPW